MSSCSRRQTPRLPMTRMRSATTSFTSDSWCTSRAKRRHVLSRPARLPAVLVRRHEGRQDRLGQPAGARRPRLAGIHADERAVWLGHSGQHVAAASWACWTTSRSAKSRSTMPTRCSQAGNRLEGGHDDSAQDRQRRQMPVQSVRSRRHSRGADELPRHREALLLAVHGDKTLRREGTRVR